MLQEFIDIETSQKEARYALPPCLDHGSEIHFATLSPIEKGYFLGVEGGPIVREGMNELYECLRANDEKRISNWFDTYGPQTRKNKQKILRSLPLNLPLSCINYIQNVNYDYFDELKKQYKFYLAGESSFGYSIANSTNDISEKKESTVLFSIGGIHSLGIGNPEDDLDVSIGKLKNRIRQIKGEEPLEDVNLKKWAHPPLFMRLANHFGNGLFGHARSLSEDTQTILDQKKHLDKGVIKTCGYDVACELLGLDESLQPTGSRRILIDMQHLSAASRNDLYQKIFRKFNKNINPHHPIPVVFTEAAYSGVDFLGEMIKNVRDKSESDNFRIQGYYGGSINLSDEDVLEVFWSQGFISLSLENWKLGNPSGGLENFFITNARTRTLKLLSRQIAGLVSIPFAYNLPSPLTIWDYINIGSGLTGSDVRMDRYRSENFMHILEQDLEEVLVRLKREEPVWFGSYRPEALVKKICHDNVKEFVLKNF
ncbi:MAG: hypothetical protein HOP08_09370 [Cyclobacteriaceae bacterium]|nr:hypothetical protein [Cyclobacteriaceae bacterium]